MIKLLLRIMLRLLYRVEVNGLDARGCRTSATLNVADHTSFLDALIDTSSPNG